MLQSFVFSMYEYTESQPLPSPQESAPSTPRTGEEPMSMDGFSEALNECQLVEENPIFVHGDQLAHHLAQGMADNWSQVGPGRPSDCHKSQSYEGTLT